jgi:dehydrogenase/reductase SDR family protein 12
VTGGTSGIGLAAAREMKTLGARVIIVGRDPGKLDTALRSLERIPDGAARGITADLSTGAGVRNLADRILEEEPGLSVVVNGASVLPAEYQQNEDGIELTVATNLLAPFLLTNLLILDVDDLEMTPDEFKGATAYARTKRAQVVLSELWADRLAGSGVVAHATHPGWVDTPGLAASLPGFHTVMGPLLRTPEEGADTIVYLAADDRPLRSNGGFWHDREERPVHRLRRTEAPAGERERLWEYLVERSGWEPSPWFPVGEDG